MPSMNRTLATPSAREELDPQYGRAARPEGCRSREEADELENDV